MAVRSNRIIRGFLTARARGLWDIFSLQWQHPSTFQNGLWSHKDWDYRDCCQLQPVSQKVTPSPVLLCISPFLCWSSAIYYPSPSCGLDIVQCLLKVWNFQIGFSLPFSRQNDKEMKIFYSSPCHPLLHTHVSTVHFSWPDHWGWWAEGRTSQTRTGSSAVEF